MKISRGWNNILRFLLILRFDLYIITIMQRVATAIFGIFLTLALGTAYLHAEPQVPSASVSAPEKIIKAVEVKGNKSISTNVIISKMKSRVGSPYQDNVISDDIKRLYLLGFFTDIKMDTQDYKDGVKIILSVTERPLIEKISFTGIRRLVEKEQKIKEKLKSREGQYLDYPSLTEDTRTLFKMYEKIGYTEVTIDYKVDVNKENNKASVQFVVVEGKRIKIKDIFVKGNRAFGRNAIVKLIKTKRAWLFNAGVMKEDVLKEDAERIKAFYRKNGYADVAVEYEVKPDAVRLNMLAVTFTIQEGKKYLVGNVTVLGNKDIKEKEILAQLAESVPGKVYSEEATKQDVSNIQSLYFDRGYISCQVQDTTSLNSNTGRVDIVYNITEHGISYVDKIKIRGNVKTRDMVVRRELTIHPGDKFDGAKLKRSKERLQSMGFFEEISYDTEDTDAQDKKNLVVDVKESKTGAFSFGGGYSTVDEFVGFVEIEQKNFDWKNWPYFTGGGQDLRFRASLGNISQGYNLSFTNPWIFDYPVSFGFDVYKTTHDRNEDVGYGYDEEVTGGDLRLGRRISDYWSTSITYRHDEIKITDITPNASNDLLQEYGKKVVSSVTPDLTFDNRDNRLAPSRGNIFYNSFEYAGGPFGGDKDYGKYYFRASHYTPLWRKATLEFKLRVGLAKPYGDSDNLPIYERFFAGGATSIRGYDERKVGPVDPVSRDPLGGNSMLIGNLEYTYPLFDFLKVAAFYDIGNVWPKLEDFASSQDFHGVNDTGGFKSGFGLGFRIKTPIGPMVLDYGIPLDKESGEEKRKSGKFHFSASHGF